MSRIIATVVSLLCVVQLAACGGELLFPGQEDSPRGMGRGEGVAPNASATFAYQRVCAGPTTIKGIDVSRWQATVDWSKVAGAGIDFAFARISYGTATLDAYFQKNWQGIAQAGLIRGGYQYYRTNQDAKAQADIVIKAVGKLGPDDLPVVMDVEDPAGYPTATQLRTWLTRVEQGTGKRPIIYTSVGYWTALQGMAEFDKYTLWVANYTKLCPAVPPLWSNWAFWQYSDQGSVPGVSEPVDMNLFNGSLAELRALANGGASGGGSTGCFYGGVQGTCQPAGTSCSGDVRGGPCATGLSCCLPPAEPPPSYGSCSYRGTSGRCQSTSNACAGSYQAGLCPGPSDIKCCLPPPPPPDYGSCTYQGTSGSCQPTTTTCSGTYRAGLCPGASNIKCCLPPPPTPSYGSCSYNGSTGICQSTSIACSRVYKSHLCPGPSTVKCCLP